MTDCQYSAESADGKEKLLKTTKGLHQERSFLPSLSDRLL